MRICQCVQRYLRKLDGSAVQTGLGSKDKDSTVVVEVTLAASCTGCPSIVFIKTNSALVRNRTSIYCAPRPVAL